MKNNKTLARWLDEGYHLFAREGREGMHVERLARILHLNKSGFYHYFGDLDVYNTKLLQWHEHRVSLFLTGVNTCDNLDPEYLLLLLKHKVTIMFQVQLTRNKEHHAFYQMSRDIDFRVNNAVQRIWSQYLGVTGNSDLCVRYYNIIRDTFYMRVTFQNLNYSFLHNLVREARALLYQGSQVTRVFDPGESHTKFERTP